MNANYLTALDAGNKVRVAMADTKKQIAGGDLDPVETILMCDLPLPVFDLLKAIPSVGAMKARRAMADLELTDQHVLSGSGRTITRSGKFPINNSQKIKLAEYVGWRVTGARAWSMTA